MYYIHILKNIHVLNTQQLIEGKLVFIQYFVVDPSPSNNSLMEELL